MVRMVRADLEADSIGVAEEDGGAGEEEAEEASEVGTELLLRKGLSKRPGTGVRPNAQTVTLEDMLLFHGVGVIPLLGYTKSNTKQDALRIVVSLCQLVLRVVIFYVSISSEWRLLHTCPDISSLSSELHIPCLASAPSSRRTCMRWRPQLALALRVPHIALLRHRDELVRSRRSLASILALLPR